MKSKVFFFSCFILSIYTHSFSSHLLLCLFSILLLLSNHFHLSFALQLMKWAPFSAKEPSHRVKREILLKIIDNLCLFLCRQCRSTCFPWCEQYILLHFMLKKHHAYARIDTTSIIGFGFFFFVYKHLLNAVDPNR